MAAEIEIIPMVIEDPNLLVTIAATKIGKLTYPNDAGWGRTGPDVALEHGFGDDATKKRICAVLEAIACLSVSNDRMQVVAVALQINMVAKTAIITIAENTTVQPRLITHITSLLTVLHEAATKFEAQLTTSHSSKSTFPTEIMAMRATVLEAVYRYSILKNLRRYGKWFPRLYRFLGLLQQAGHKTTDGRIIRETLQSTYDDLKTILGYNKGKKGEFTAEQWGKLIDAMDRIIPLTNAFCNECEKFATAPYASTWEKEWKTAGDEKRKPWATNAADGIKTFPVRHAVGKLTSQHRYMQNLLKDVTSPGISRLFLCTFTVRAVPVTPAVPIILPRDPAELKAVVKAMYELAESSVSSHVIDPVVASLVASIARKPMYLKATEQSANGVVHCECAVVAYLEGIRQKIVNETDVTIKAELIKTESPPFNYLGVSKLSCGACHAWLTAYNSTTTSLKYHTAGTHSMWYSLWAMPPSLSTGDLGDEMAKIVCKRFVRYCQPTSEEPAPVEGTGSAFAGTWRGSRW